MKIKFITVLLIMLLAFQSFAFAGFQLGTVTDELELSGVAEPYERVSFMLLNSDNMGFENAEDTVKKYYENIDAGVKMSGTEIFHFENVKANSNGEWSYTIPMAGFVAQDGREAVDLTLVISTGEQEFIRYSSIQFRKDMIPVLKGKAELEDISELSQSISEYIDYITDQGQQYKKLDNKTKIAQFNHELIKGLDVSSDSAIGQLQIGLDEAILVQSVDEGNITDFNKAMEIVEYNKSDVVNMSDDGVAKHMQMLAGQDYASINNYKDYAKVQFAIQLFNYNVNQSGDNLLSVLEANNGVLKLDLSELNKLDASEQALAAKQLAGKLSEGTDEMQGYLDDIVDDLGGSLGGGSSSAGGGSGIGSSVPENKLFPSSAGASITEENLQQQKYIYSDMSQADWAADAIVFLAENGIINGYDDNTFRPLNPITRAEFTKIIVEAFFADEIFEFSGNFSDISASDWYAKYVNIAYNMGVVSGDQNGNFNPNETISRQDMSVIIYNAGAKFGLFEKIDDYTAFGDDASISDYARNAVYTLKNKKIVNGVGENMFAPLESANRASAAKIIYELMTKYNK